VEVARGVILKNGKNIQSLIHFHEPIG